MARSVAQADTDTLGAVLQAMPRGELRRLYWAAADILEVDAPSETDGSVDEDWQDPDLGVHAAVPADTAARTDATQVIDLTLTNTDDESSSVSAVAGPSPSSEAPDGGHGGWPRVSDALPPPAAGPDPRRQATPQVPG